MSEKTKRTAIFLYIVGFIIGFIFVYRSINTDNVKVVEKPAEEKVEEIKPTTVTLDINGSQEYKVELTNEDRIIDLLMEARKSGVLSYDITEYTTRYELTFYNNSGTQKYRGTIMVGTEDLTSKVKETKLIDDTTYTLRLTPTN